MNFESGFEGVPPQRKGLKEIITAEFIFPLGFDSEMPINSGGITIGKTIDGELLYGLTSHFDEDTKSAIEKLCGQNDLRREAFGSILQEIQPYVWVAPDSISFVVSGTPVLTVSESEGIVFDTHELTEDGSIIRTNIERGKNNPPRPTSSPYYQFEIQTSQDEPVVELQGVEYGAILTAGIRLRSIDAPKIKKIFDLMKQNKCMTSENIQKIIDPYFKIDLLSYNDLLHEITKMGGY